MRPSIKILSVNNKWANVMYNSSSARSRMRVAKLLEQHENDNIEILNPEMLEQEEF